jgi:hypothetical protein
MFDKIEIHFTFKKKNGETAKRRAIILPGSGVKAIRLEGGERTTPPNKKDVRVVSDTKGDRVQRMDAGPLVCYEIGEDTVCW